MLTPSALSFKRVCQSGLSSRAAQSACASGPAVFLEFLRRQLRERHRQQFFAALEGLLVEKELLLFHEAFQIVLNRVARVHLLEFGQEQVAQGQPGPAAGWAFTRISVSAPEFAWPARHGWSKATIAAHTSRLGAWNGSCSWEGNNDCEGSIQFASDDARG